MIDPNQKEKPPVDPADVCRRSFELIRSGQLDEAEKLLTYNLKQSDGDVACGLYHSALGVLFKVRRDFKEAWRHYQRAEKLMPADPALKIIVARLLIEQFSEYDGAIKRCKKVLELLPRNPVFGHQAYTTMGMAYVRKRDKEKALEALGHSLIHEFQDFVTARNIDFHLVEMVLRNGWGVDLCRIFLEKALAFARAKKEENFVEAFEKMRGAFLREYVD